MTQIKFGKSKIGVVEASLRQLWCYDFWPELCTLAGQLEAEPRPEILELACLDSEYQLLRMIKRPQVLGCRCLRALKDYVVLPLKYYYCKLMS